MQQNQSMPMDNVKAKMMKKGKKMKGKKMPSFEKVAKSVKKTMGY